MQRLIIILWCMLENIHETNLLQPMGYRYQSSLEMLVSQRESSVLVLLAPLGASFEINYGLILHVELITECTCISL